jgi:transposase
MKYYAGLDVSMKTTSICIVNQEKKIVFESEVPTDPNTIFSAIRGTGLDIENSAVESGSISHWLVQELSRKKMPIICVDARKMSRVLSININKNDKNDARLIAEALRCGFYSEVQQKPQEDVEMKILMGSRRSLIETHTKLKNTIRGHLKAFGIRLGTASNHKFEGLVQQALKDKPEVVKMGIKGLVETLKNINGQIALLDKKIEELAMEDEDVKLLTTIPGVGIVIAYTFKAHLGDPSRFKTSRAVGAYFGMTPTQYSSGEVQKQGRVSKCGAPEVRSLLNEAAFAMLYASKSWSRIKVWGLKIKKKKGHKKAMMAVGRKLCVLMHRMLITRKPFEYGSPKENEKKIQAVS